MSTSLKGSKTEGNLTQAVIHEFVASIRYVNFTKRAEIERCSEAAEALRSIAKARVQHALGHLEHLERFGDPIADETVDDTENSLKSAIEAEAVAYSYTYPTMARTARDEGLSEIADWFETLAKAKKSHSKRIKNIVDQLKMD